MSDKIQRIAAEKSASTPSIAPVAKPAPKRAAAGEAAADLASPVNAPALPGYSLSQIGIHYGAPAPIQAKLTVGPVNDHYEQEADSVAQRVVEQINAPVAQRQELPKEDEEKVQTKPVISAIQRQEMPKEEEDKLQTKSLVASIQRAEMPKDDEEKVQTKPLASTIQRQEQPDDEEKLQTKPQSNVLQRQETPEDEEKVQTKSLMGTVQRQETPEDEDKLQTKAADNALQRQADQDDETLQSKPQIQRRADSSMAATPDLESAIQQSRGSGQSLSDSTRQPMEQAFGADFSKVKVHTDARADQLNRSIQARAFTTGQDIYFRQGEHSPGTRAGQELLAHELTHVVQQGGAQIRTKSVNARSSHAISSSGFNRAQTLMLSRIARAPLFRGMTEDGGLPQIGDTARDLGVRNSDVDLDSTGKVSPGKGMSTASGAPTNLPAHRRPSVFGGTGKDPVWQIDDGQIKDPLKSNPDGKYHVSITCIKPMPLANFRTALANTRNLWTRTPLPK